MKKKNQAEGKPTLTNTTVDEEYTIASDVSTYNPQRTNAYYPGDSVDEHKELEQANLDFITQDEIKQQNENL